MSTPRIAFLGTGLMGGPMATNLLKAGFPVVAWNRTLAKAEALRPAGATIAPGAASAAEGADVVITMLESGPIVETLLFDTHVVVTLKPGALVIDAEFGRAASGPALTPRSFRRARYGLSRCARERRHARCKGRHARDHGRRQRARLRAGQADLRSHGPRRAGRTRRLGPTGKTLQPDHRLPSRWPRSPRRCCWRPRAAPASLGSAPGPHRRLRSTARSCRSMADGMLERSKNSSQAAPPGRYARTAGPSSRPPANSASRSRPMTERAAGRLFEQLCAHGGEKYDSAAVLLEARAAERKTPRHQAGSSAELLPRATPPASAEACPRNAPRGCRSRAGPWRRGCRGWRCPGAAGARHCPSR